MYRVVRSCAVRTTSYVGERRAKARGFESSPRRACCDLNRVVDPKRLSVSQLQRSEQGHAHDRALTAGCVANDSKDSTK
ncbi:hypothetical protein ABZP36_002753 [Zizania latifolia]